MTALPKNSFLDRAGRLWQLELNYGLATRIRKSLGVDLANAHNGEALQQLGTDDELLVATLFALVEEQAQRAEVSPEAFTEALDGEVLEHAGEALSEMIRLFTRPAIRPVIEAMLAKGTEGRTAAIELATKKLQSPSAQAAIDRQLAKLDQQLEAALTGTSSPTNGPASSE
jgi:hypothetical protein